MLGALESVVATACCGIAGGLVATPQLSSGDGSDSDATGLTGPAPPGNRFCGRNVKLALLTCVGFSGDVDSVLDESDATLKSSDEEALSL